MKRALLLLALGVACDGAHEANAAGELASQRSDELMRAIALGDDLAPIQAAIDSGHPWRATQMVAPLLRDAKTRTHAALLVAARAAAGWDGWSEIDKLLAKEPWIDTEFDGEARELLARAAFGNGADSAALVHASAAARVATPESVSATRLVLLARALERTTNYDSAAVVYRRAAAALRPVRDWLQLRAVGNERDAGERANAAAAVTIPSAKARVGWTEAQARERFSDAAGAAAQYATLGAPVQSLRLRLSVAVDSASRDTIRRALLAVIGGRRGSNDARAAVDVLDKGFEALTPAEELVVARSAAASGPPSRAVSAFARAFRVPRLITANDRYLYAQSLSRVGRTKDALAQFALVRGTLAGSAAYQRARILLTSGRASATRAALRDVVKRYAKQTGPASDALYLLADLSTDDGNDAGARALFRQLYRQYPSSSRASDARFRAAMIAFTAGNVKQAAAEFDSLYTLHSRSDEALAARYWSGRALAAAGNEALAKTRWHDVIAQQPTSYYSFVGARRLGEKPWSPPAAADSIVHVASVDSAVARAELLERLGMETEARFEYDAVEAAAGASPTRLLASAQALLAHGQPSRAMRLAQKLIDSGKKDAQSYRLAYPAVDNDEIVRAAKAHDLDPALVAGLIRQESNFTPRAVSPAGARGLMQVLPSVGREVARSLNYPVWYPALLLDADANLQLGTAHLASYIKEYGALPRVLAAYNAGGSRVKRWSTKAGMDDPELFAERIPFAETRDYVRIVQRNAVMYRELYRW